MSVKPTSSVPRGRLGSAAAVVLLLVPPLCLLAPAIFGGEMMSPSGYLANWVPWKGASPLDASLGNPLLSDVPLAIDPWLSYAKTAISNGWLPLWNPYVLSGTPFYTNPQVGLFSPFNVSVWILPFGAGVALGALFKLWLAAVGAWLLARELGCGKATALVAGIAFSLCSFNIVWLAHGAHISVTALLPLALVFTERLIDQGRRRDLLGLWVTVTAALLGGHPGSELHLAMAVVIWAGVRLGLSAEVDWRRRLTLFGFVCLGLFAAALTASFILVPIEMSVPGTRGEDARQGGGLALSFRALATTLFPDLWGRPVGAVGAQVRYFAPKLTTQNYNERTIFAGSAAMIFALYGLLVQGKWRTRAPLLALGGVGLLVPFNLLGASSLLGALPLFENATNSRLTVWFQLAVSVLAAVGLQALVDKKIGGWRKAAPLVVCWGAAAIALVIELPRSDGLRPAISFLVHGLNSSTQHGRVAVAALLWAGLMMLAAGALSLLSSRLKPAVLIGLATVLVGVESVHFASGYQPVGPAAKVEPAATPAISFLQRHSSEGRVAGLSSSLVHDYGLKFGLRDVRGQDAPQPSQRYVRLWRTAGRVSSFRMYVGPRVSKRGLKVLRMLGVKWIITPPGFHSHDLLGLPAAYSGRDARVFEVPNPAPDTFIARQVFAADNLDRELSVLKRADFNPAHDAVVQASGKHPKGAVGTARIVKRGHTSVEIKTRSNRPSVLVLSESLTAGWTVKVDGREAKPISANIVFRGVNVGAGRHVVRWDYAVPGLKLGIGISIFSLVVGGLGLFAIGRKSYGLRLKGATDSS